MNRKRLFFKVLVCGSQHGGTVPPTPHLSVNNYRTSRCMGCQENRPLDTRFLWRINKDNSIDVAIALTTTITMNKYILAEVSYNTSPFHVNVSYAELIIGTICGCWLLIQKSPFATVEVKPFKPIFPNLSHSLLLKLSISSLYKVRLFFSSNCNTLLLLLNKT